MMEHARGDSFVVITPAPVFRKNWQKLPVLTPLAGIRYFYARSSRA
jgi:hypothetical protein